MPRLKSDLLTALLAARDGVLSDFDLRWRDEAALTVVMASKGYPGAYEKGHEIFGLDAAASLPGVTLFHAGTERRDGKIVAIGGRVLNVTATGQDVAEAQAPRLCTRFPRIHWEGASAAAISAGAALNRLTALDLGTRAAIATNAMLFCAPAFFPILLGLAALLDRPPRGAFHL